MLTPHEKGGDDDDDDDIYIYTCACVYDEYIISKYLYLPSYISIYL